MRHRSPLPVLALTLIALGACEEHEYQPPDPAERVAEAETAFSPALFDTITWASDSVRIEAGNLVYADECRRCHGTLGQGNTEYARTNGLDVPSLVRTDWQAGDDVEAIRRRVFTGHPAGMPVWGVGRLTPRQIDAAAFYIVHQLRPEVSDTSTLPGLDRP